MSIPSYPFHSLPFKLPNKRMDFPFPPLKLSNKRMEEYSKIILFISFHSILFPPPKRGLNVFTLNELSISRIMLNAKKYLSFFDSNILINYLLFKKFKLLKIIKFNNLTIILTKQTK